MTRMISYAQNHEDVLLDRVFRGRTSGFYVDVGAWDPVVDSVTRHFHAQGWRGVNVEPNPAYLEKLRRGRPEDVNLGVALAERSGRRTLHVLPDSGLSTLHPELLVHDGFRRENASPTEVPVETLAHVCEEHAPGRIDFLKIDVEGAEHEVIAGGDWHRYRPVIVVVEATRPLTAEPSWMGWEPTLLQADYLHVYDDGLNRYYVRVEDRNLASHFQFPVGPQDDYVSYEAEHLRSRYARLHRRMRRRMRAHRWLRWIPGF